MQKMAPVKSEASPAMHDYLKDLGDDLFFGELSSDSLLRPNLAFNSRPSPAESDSSPSSHSDSMVEDSDLFGIDHSGHRSSLDTVLTEDANHKPKRIAKKTSDASLASAVPQALSMAPPAPLPIFHLQLHGIPDKSRVETQIKLGLRVMELLPDGSRKLAGDRFHWLKLPAWGMAKEKLKLKNRRDMPDTIDPSKILFLDARVVKSTEPLEDVKICQGCIIRERKRAQRKKDSAKHKTRTPEVSTVPPEDIPLADEEKKILVFNCPELLEMDNGNVFVPTRVTCYCRHHKEKVGFRLIVMLRDAAGHMLATTTSELVLITDDHKTLGKPATLRGQTEEMSSQSTVVKASGTSPQQLMSDRGPSRRSSMSSGAAGRKRKADPVNIAPNLAPKVQKVPSALSMTRMARDELHCGVRREPVPPVPMSASTSRAASPSTARSLHRSHSQDSLLQFMNLHEEREPLTADMLRITSPSRSHHWETTTERPLERSISLSPRTRTLEYLMDSATRHAGAPGHFAGQARQLSGEAPTINRLIPAEGPLQGGVEITVLGSGFYPGLTCMFGDVAAVPTHCWSPTTMVCVLPPSSQAGVVSVTFREHPYNAFVPTSFPGKPFTYVDDTDRALMELALQVIGLKSTGKLETARDVALRICQNSMPSESASGHIANLPIQQLRMALNIAEDVEMDVEALLVKCLALVDLIPTTRPPRFSHRNKSGHTMLHLASLKGYSEFAHNLLMRGANVNVRDRSGFTALHFAALCNQYDVAADMLAGPDTNASLSTSDGMTAYDLAAMTDNTELIALCDPWSWTQSLGRSVRSNSVASQASTCEMTSNTSASVSSSSTDTQISDAISVERIVRAQGIATQPSSRAASPAPKPIARRRSSVSQIDPDTASATLEDLKSFATSAKETEAVQDGQPDHQTLAQHIGQLQQSWAAFLTATSPAWIQKVTGAQAIQDRIKNSSQLQHLPSIPPLMAFQAMLPTMPNLPMRFSSKDTDTQDATWLGNLVSSIGAPPTYAEATAAIPLFGAMSRSKVSQMDSTEEAAGSSSASPAKETPPAKRRSWWPAKTVSLRQQNRIVDLTPAEQRAQAKRFQKPCDRMMLLFWLPCLLFFVLLSVFKVTFGRVLSWVV